MFFRRRGGAKIAASASRAASDPGRIARSHGLFLQLRGQRHGIEGLMQSQRSAAQQPRHQCQCNAGEGGRGHGRHDVRIRRETAFSEHRQAARQQLGVTARDRHDAVRRRIECDRRDMQSRVVAALGRKRNVRAGRDLVEKIVERHGIGHRPKSANTADRENRGRDLHRERCMIGGADARAGHQRLGSDPRQSRDAIGAPPQHGHRRRDHSRAHDAEQREHALDCIRELRGDDRIRRQSDVAQSLRNGRDHAIDLRIGEFARFAVGERRAVGRIDERDRVRPARGVEAQDIVERGARAAASAARIAKDHDSLRARATRFPADSRTAGWSAGCSMVDERAIHWSGR